MSPEYGHQPVASVILAGRSGDIPARWHRRACSDVLIHATQRVRIVRPGGGPRGCGGDNSQAAVRRDGRQERNEQTGDGASRS
jgi:hypothetical protein